MLTSAPSDHLSGRTRSRGSWRLVLAVGLVAAVTAPGVAAHAQTTDDTTGVTVDQTPSDGDYVTTTTAAERGLDVSGFAPVCIRDAPFINYTIVPIGFTPVDSSATLVIRAANGTVVSTQTVDSLSGQIIWPGASIDAAGNATDWPGWQRAADGISWIPDPSDAVLRDGLSIEVTVDPNVTATATVSYPPDDSPCANPPSEQSEPTCVPGQNNDDNPSDDCELSRTGGGPGNLVLIGAGALLAGLLIFTATRRRRGDIAPGAG